jgi:hypothetical protein
MGEMTGQDASTLLASEVDALMEMVAGARRQGRTDKRIIAAVIGGYQLSVLLDGHEGTAQLMAALVLRLEARERELVKVREDAAETEAKLRTELAEWRSDMRSTDDLATQRGRALADITTKYAKEVADNQSVRKQLGKTAEALATAREECEEANEAATRWRKTAERDLSANESLRKELAELADCTVPRSRYTEAATELAAQVRRNEQAKRELAQVMDARDSWRSQAEHYKAEALRMGSKVLES